MAERKRFGGWDVAKFFALFPLYAVRGCFVIVGATIRLVRSARGAKLALASELVCPSCGEPNATIGRWTCGVCHATYHGWVGRSRVCRAGCGWFPCTCGVAITLPWERP